jgi:toxin ParE1/3/4
MSVRYSDRAAADILAIASYISERRPSGAASVLRRLAATFNLIGRHPGVGLKVRARKGVLVIPVGKYPYQVYYRLDDAGPIIVHIRHGARKLPQSADLE